MVAPGEVEALSMRPMRAEDASGVIRLLRSEGFINDLSDEKFLNLFHYPWMQEPPNLGYVLLADHRIVGSVNITYRKRLIEGRWHLVAIGSTLYVATDFRSRTVGGQRTSLSLIDAVVRDYPGVSCVVLTALGPRKVMRRILPSLGYTCVGERKLVYPATYGLFSRTGKEMEILSDPHEVESRLDGEQLQIMRDHEPYGCRHYLLRTSQGSCLVVTKKRPVKLEAVLPWLPIYRLRKRTNQCSEVLHISDSKIAATCWPQLASAIIRQERSPVLVVQDSILGPGAPATRSLEWPIYAKGEIVRHGLVDLLYSEIILLPI